MQKPLHLKHTSELLAIILSLASSAIIVVEISIVITRGITAMELDVLILEINILYNCLKAYMGMTNIAIVENEDSFRLIGICIYMTWFNKLSSPI
jgi:hypothetical protein